MEVIRTIQPGKPGSVRFHRRWKDRLVAVRYRRDSRSNRLVTTVDLIVDEREQPGPVPLPDSKSCYGREQVVAVSIGFKEYELRESAKKMGAHWSRQRKVWLMRYHIAVALGVKSRIVHGLVDTEGR